jgi:hypothetical protein
VHSMIAPLPRQNRLCHFLTTILLGGGVGLGLLSCLFFLTIEFNASRTFLYWLCEIILVLTATAAYLICQKRRQIEEPIKQDENVLVASKSRLDQTLEHLITVCFVISVVAIAIRGSFFWMHESVGSWDAWSYWNCRAIGIVRAGNEWKVLLAPDAPFADYPMLLPSCIAGCWKILKDQPLMLPRALSVFFSLSLYGLLFSALAQMRGLREAKVGTMIVLGTQVVARFIAAQTADGPYCYYLLSAVVSAASYSFYRKHGFALLCGLFVGFAAFTKNEGLLFAALTGGAAFLWILKHRQNTDWSAIKWFAAGIIVPLSMAVFTKLTGSHDYLQSSPIALYEKRTVLDVLKLCFFYGSDFGHWVWNPVPLIIGYILVSGVRVPARLKPVWVTLLISFVLTMSVYGLIYIRRLPAYQDIEHNLDRLIGHWFVILVFIILVTLNHAADNKPTLLAETARE